MAYLLSDSYGGAPPAQPPGTSGPHPNPGTTATSRTVARPGLFGQPSFWLVVLVAIFFGLVKISVGVST
jgi:hypothetical protein